MFVIRLWNYLKGYVIIRVEGLTLEKFINLSIAKDIFLWDIIRIDYTTMEAKVSTEGFKELKKIVKSVGCRVCIKDKQGLPFFIYKFKYRKMFPIGLLVSIGTLMYLTTFVWTVDIIGNQTIKGEVINDYLQSIDIGRGIRKKHIDSEEIRDKILTDIEEISHVSIHIKGTKLILDIRERDEESRVVEDESPCNIIASKRAVIEKVIAKNGKSVVAKGDIVKKGQLLISGVIHEEGMEQSLLVHSEGKVIGLTTHNETIKESITKNIKEETGKVHISRELKVNGKSLEFMNGDIPFKNYIQKKEVKRPLSNDILDIPIEIIINEYKEVNLREVKQNTDALKETNEVKTVQSLMEKLPEGAEVLSKDTVHSIENNILTTKVIIDVREEIGIKSKLNKTKQIKKQED